jgi:hypothetical protein
MNRGSALRYLLLRQLWVVRDKVPLVSYEEVTKSLQVSIDRENYIVVWMREGVKFEKLIPRNNYVFYKVGDRTGSAPANFSSEEQNLTQARAFALEALGGDFEADAFTAKERVGNPHDIISFLANLLFCITLAVIGGETIRYLAVFLFVVLSVEFIPRIGRALVGCSLWGIIAVGFPFVVLVVGLSYAVAEFLDPNPKARSFRVCLGLFSCLGALVYIDFSSVNLPDIVAALVVFFVLFFIFILRLMIGVHSRIMPLIGPFAAVGLAVDGYLSSALLMVGYALICFLSKMYGHRIVALQRDLKHTPNG